MTDTIKEIPANWLCSSLDHNESSGCSNLDCFNRVGPISPAWEELDQNAMGLWKLIAKRKGAKR